MRPRSNCDRELEWLKKNYFDQETNISSPAIKRSRGLVELGWGQSNHRHRTRYRLLPRQGMHLSPIVVVDLEIIVNEPLDEGMKEIFASFGESVGIQTNSQNANLHLVRR